MQSLIKPQLKYNFTPNTSFRDIPNIDPYDRMNQSNSITYSFNHYLYGIKEGAQRELPCWKSHKPMDFREILILHRFTADLASGYPILMQGLTLYPITNLTFTNQTSINVHGEGVKATTNTLSYDCAGKIPCQCLAQLFKRLYQ